MFGGSKKHGGRVLTLILATVLIVGGVVSGTFAWLIAETSPVVNTFSYGDIDLELEETKTDKKGNPVDEDGDGPDKTTGGNEYEMIPGKEYLKDPTATVLAGNEECWLFVKLEEKDGSNATYKFGDYLTYEVSDNVEDADEWTALQENGVAVKGVYYRYVGEDTDNTGVSFEVLKGNTIKVKNTVDKAMLNALDNNGQDTTATYPSLSVTAYAVQYSGFEAMDSSAKQMNAAALKAWKAVEEQTATP